MFRVAIAPSRIVRFNSGKVSFRYKRSGEKKVRTCELDAMEFIRRYLQHVLPHGFTKVRHYGFLAPLSEAHIIFEENRAKPGSPRLGLQKIRELICRLYELLPPPSPPKKPHPKPWKCKRCGGLIRWLAFVPYREGYG